MMHGVVVAQSVHCGVSMWSCGRVCLVALRSLAWRVGRAPETGDARPQRRVMRARHWIVARDRDRAVRCVFLPTHVALRGVEERAHERREAPDPAVSALSKLRVLDLLLHT